jgi:hypothetical protein
LAPLKSTHPDVDAIPQERKDGTAGRMRKAHSDCTEHIFQSLESSLGMTADQQFRCSLVAQVELIDWRCAS